MSVELKQGAVVIDGRPTFVYSGEIQPYRLPAGLWQDRLEKARAAGLNCVGCYFGWNFHAPDAETVDFSSPDRDLARFLELAAQAGLYVFARPGPYVCNEWDLGGFPGWLLAEEQGDWRTGDPRHLAWERRWYSQINPVLAPYQHGRQGSVILYQVENEHFWGDKPLFEGLAQEARANGITVPLVSNSGGSVNLVGAQGLVDGMDCYTDVNELYRWRGWADVLRRRQLPDNPLMVLEYRGSTITLWGDPPPSDLSLPPAWVPTQDRLYIAMGANVLNHFISVGGLTPVGYGSDHITTSYGDDAAVSPWGELTPQFYLLRRLGLLLESLNDALMASTPWPTPWLATDPRVDCTARHGERGTFFFAVNSTGEPLDYALTLPDGRRLPAEGVMPMGPHESQTLVADLDLGAGRCLDFCSAQIFSLWEDGGNISLVVYGPEGHAACAEFSGAAQLLQICFTCTAAVQCVEGDLGNCHVTLYATTPEVAGKTWPVEEQGRTVPLFSNLSLVRPGRDEQGALRAELPAGETLWLVAPGVSALTVNGERLPLTPRADGLGELHHSRPAPGAVTLELGPAQARAEADWTATLGTAEEGWLPLEAAGPEGDLIIDPGTYEYQTTFLVGGEPPRMLEFMGLSHVEVVVSLNGQQIGVWPPTRPAGYPHAFRYFGLKLPVEGVLCPGENLLSVSVTLVGRHNSGRPIYAGLSHPVVLYRTPGVQEIPVWETTDPEPHAWDSAELAASPAPAQPSTDRSGWRSEDTREVRAYPHAESSQWRHVRWYHACVTVAPELRGKPLFLECPYWEEAWAYVDGVCVGSNLTGTQTTFDLTAYADRAELDLTVALRYQWQGGNWALTAPPKLVTADQVLRGAWQKRLGAEGQREQWAAATDGWADPAATAPARRVWYRREVHIERPADLVAPVYVELHDVATYATLYWNGHPIGQYAPAGPDRRFYVWDDLIQADNTLVLEVDGYPAPAAEGQVSLGVYYQSVPLRLELE
ncbi:MAG TPA: beta-galactosidase [Armatimonadota bacterium]|jgi:hypothetical protein